MIPSEHETTHGPTSGVPAAKLLVSVKDVVEAELAKQAGVDWIDLKSPDAGPLGQPSPEVAASVAAALAEFRQKSIALGELSEVNALVASEMCEDYPIAKVGLKEEGRADGWQNRLCDLADRIAPTTHLVPVAYADFAECDAPSPEDVLGAAVEIDAPHVLIDTCSKDGRGLTEWLTSEQLAEIIAAAAAKSISVVLAGSLRKDDLAALMPLGAFAIAVRGAVCEPDRGGAISGAKLADWVELFAKNAVQPS